MKLWFKLILIIIITCECVAGVLLGFEVFRRIRTQVSGATSVSVIHKSSNALDRRSKLVYYYEPIPGETETDSAPWLPQKIERVYNNDGLNDRYNYATEKPPKTFRIIALGDSITFGDHVNTADSWPEKLEDLLNENKICPDYNKYEVLNFGVNGYDIQYEVERYRLRGAKYNPDLVVWMLIDNDFDEINELLLPRTREIYQQLNEESLIDPKNPYKVPDVLSKNEFLKKYDEKVRFSMISGFVQDFNRLYQGRLLFLTFPFLDDRYLAWVQQWARERKNTYYYSELPDIYKDPNLNFRQYGVGHPTVAGHEVIAQAIYQYLKNQIIFRCASL